MANLTAAQAAELARLALLSAVEVAAAKAGLSVEEMCNVIDANPHGAPAMFVRKLIGIT